MPGALARLRSALWLRLTGQIPPPGHAVLPPLPPGWRPFPLRPVYLSLLAGIMFLLLIVLELLRRYSEQYAGLVFFEDMDDLSPIESFAYNYIPIIVAIGVVTLWSFVDFDVLRLEPYFQIARPQGAPASVLFINYNFGQTILTPITSAKRRHWIVLTVSVLTLCTRIFLPALQSTMLELREVSVLADDSINTWPHLVDPATQASWIASEERNSYDAAWTTTSSKNTLHRSRSAQFAVAPVEIPTDDPRESTLWTVNQTIYWTEATCRDVLRDDQLRVTINETDPSYQTVSWDVEGVQLQPAHPHDGKKAAACTVDFHYENVFFPTTDFLQVRYWEPAWSDNRSSLPSAIGRRAFSAQDCSSDDLYGVLVSINATEAGADSIAALGQQYTSSATMFACNIDYYRAEAEVTMHANSSITEIKVDNHTKTPLTLEQFNVSAFQGLLAHRAPYTSDMIFMEYNATSHDHSITELPVVSQDLGDLEPVMVLDTATVMTQREFEDKVTRGVQQTFLLTMGRLFNPDVHPTNVYAQRLTRQVTIAVISFAALWSEIILGLGTALAIFLLYLYKARPNILQSDPGSIGAMCSMLTDVFGLSNILADAHPDLHQYSTRQLRQLLGNSRLFWHYGPLGRRLEIVPAPDSRHPSDLGEELRARVDPRPHFLVIPIFILEFILLASVIAAMAVVVASLAHEGSFEHLSQSDSSFLQVLLSFMPSVVASSVGALCNSIHRNLSILEPWVHLQRGMAPSRLSLSMNYASQNPWAVFVKAVRHRHLLLIAVSLACVANAVLTVVAGGLFTQRLTESNLPTQDILTNYSQSYFQRSDFAADFTEYDLIQTSITSGVPMLSWTSPGRSFMPLKVENPDADALYSATTLGVGADLECRPLSIDQNLVQDTPSAYWKYALFKEPEQTCIVNMSSLDRPKSEGLSTSIHFLSPVGDDEVDECQTQTVMVLGRWNYTTNTPLTEHNTVALHCEPHMRMQNYSVTFDQKGQIKESNALPHSVVDSGPMFDNATVSLGQFNKVFAAIPQSYAGQQPVTRSQYVSSYDWAGFLVARLYKQREPSLTSLNAATLMDTSQVVYQWVYSTYFSLWREIYLLPLQDPPTAPNAYVIYSMWCMIPSVPSLAIALLIIALDTLVVLVVFGTRRGRFQGPRIPRSIGAVIPWIAHSRMLGDYQGTYAWTSTQRRDHMDRLDKRYGFRLFVGRDGRWRYAVDEEEEPMADTKPPTGGPSPPAGEGPKPGEVIELREIRDDGAGTQQNS